MKIRGAIFDQDGLLFDTENVYDRCWHEAAAEFGLTLPAAFTRSLCGRGAREQPAKVAEWFPAIDAAAYVKRAFELGEIALMSQTPILKPGVAEILKFCKASGIKTAIASSAKRCWIEHNLEATSLRGSFDAVVAGEDVKDGKPAPDIFLRAASLIGLKPGECAVFEDAPAGIIAAHAAGCRAVMVPDRIEPTAEIRALCTVIPSLHEALALLS